MMTAEQVEALAALVERHDNHGDCDADCSVGEGLETALLNAAPALIESARLAIRYEAALREIERVDTRESLAPMYEVRRIAEEALTPPGGVKP